ncbi:hypothetical protein ACEN2A_01845 [Corynebacterium auriscanis]|uniref:hypothetical protein n=1 Tax=Corynebacterium auriscanis TaxID=99807 RepID=UPI003CEC0AE3
MTSSTEEKFIQEGNIDIIKVDGKWHAAYVGSAKWHNIMNDWPMAYGADTPEEALNRFNAEQDSHIESAKRLESQLRTKKKTRLKGELEKITEELDALEADREELREIRDNIARKPASTTRDDQLAFIDEGLNACRTILADLEEAEREIKFAIRQS